MTDLLRKELARLAEDAPTPHPVDLAPDAWRRGRRARRLDRAVVLGVVAAVLVVLGGTASLLVTAPPRIAPAAPVDAPAAVPTELHAVPEHVLTDPAFRTSDLALGQQAAAFWNVTAPVVVSATDGSYHLLDLPGWPSLGSTDPAAPLALSPDGRQLAWAYLDADGATGVRIADLDDGAVREVPVVPADEPGPQQVVAALAWSPSGTWLAWASGVLDQPGWVSAGRVAPGSMTTDPTPVREGGSGLAVADDGRLVLTEPGYAFVIGEDGPGAGFSLQRSLDPTAVAVVSPDGTRVAVGSRTPNGAVDVLDLDRQRVRLAYFNGYDGDASHRALGWRGDDRVVVAADVPTRGTEVVLVPAPGNNDDGEVVVTRADSVLGSLSVAVDLLDRPTVDRPAPDWPWSEQRQRLVLGGAGLLVLLAAAAAVVVRRRPVGLPAR